MAVTLKAIVIKTPQFKATQQFFAEVLKAAIHENSACHFVIHTKNIRVVFMAAAGSFEVALYFEQKAASAETPALKHLQAPNGIHITITNNTQQQ